METLTRLDLDLAYTSEKLMNLDNLLMRVLILGNDIEAAFEYEKSTDLTEKTMEYDLLRVILSSGVKELDRFIRTIPALINDGQSMLSGSQESDESYEFIRSKLHDAEETLGLLQERILEMKMQLTKVQMSSSAFIQNKGRSLADIGLSENFQVPGIPQKSELQSIEERQILRMLEKSLARELDVEKKLTEMKQNEEDLKLKLRLTEQVADCMEEAGEVIWGRFLEAENAAEVLNGISKEMVGRLQTVHFSFDSLRNREEQLNLKIQEYTGLLKSKEDAIEKLKDQHSIDNAQIATLRERATYLEVQLRESVSRLKEANASLENNQEQLAEMESMIETMKDTIDETETRADDAEAKVAQLTESNMELGEELNFLKGSNDGERKKVSLLESQLRDLELQLQQAKASSEASQEQQNMLYSAIWDMETLIDELKQKVSNAESKTEQAEEQCVRLSEANLELNREVEYLKSKLEVVETSLSRSTNEKMASAKDINIKANIVMDMVMQLVSERERIQQKFYALAKANNFLMDSLMKARKDASSMLQENLYGGTSVYLSSLHDLKTNSHEAIAPVNVVESASTNLQADESLGNPTEAQIKEESSISTEPLHDIAEEADAEVVEAGRTNRLYIYLAIFILFLSLLATFLFNGELPISNIFDR